MRIPQMLVVLWLLVTIVFVTVALAPGDPTLHLALDPEVPREARLLQQQRLGLDQSLMVRYGRYVGSLAVGDFGVSMSLYPRSVTGIIAERLPRTVALLGTATVLAFVAGFTVGRWAAWRRGTTVDHVTSVVSVAVTTAFVPWVAFTAIWLFAFEFGWLPSGRLVTPALWRDAPWSANEVIATIVARSGVVLGVVLITMAVLRILRGWLRPKVVRFLRGAAVALTITVFGWSWIAHPMRSLAADIVWHAILPTITLTVLAFGATALLTRTAMLEAITSPHVAVAAAHGLDDRVVRNRHVARVALQPLGASLVLSAAGVVAGSIVFETIFSWPGLGMTFMAAAVSGDVPLVVGVLVTYAIVFLVLHVVLEIVQPMLDPRVARAGLLDGWSWIGSSRREDRLPDPASEGSQ
ncbi:MAG: ABC transporter permease [Nitriliruptoraceae bacterium]